MDKQGDTHPGHSVHDLSLLVTYPNFEEIIELLVQHKANLEARTAHSGLLVSKAGLATPCRFVGSCIDDQI